MICVICRSSNNYNVIGDYHICFNCFHTCCKNKKTLVVKNEICDEICDEKNKINVEYLLKEIELLKAQYVKVNIVSVNAKDTFILDKIKEKFDKDVTTTSISENFNPSYFSKHKCYKLSLDMYVNMDNYEKFDIIIINKSFDYKEDPCYFLKLCKMIVEGEGYIYCSNTHTSVLLSCNYINLDNNIKHIWSTNSMKTLCRYTDTVLLDVFKQPAESTRLYKIQVQKRELEFTRKITEELYDEICIGLYNIAPYYHLNTAWNNYFNMCNYIFTKYRDQNYEIVGINNKECDFFDINLYIKEDDINENYINENYINENKNDINNHYKSKVVFVILNYTRYRELYEKLDIYLKKRGHLIFDLEKLIAL